MDVFLGCAEGGEVWVEWWRNSVQFRSDERPPETEYWFQLSKTTFTLPDTKKRSQELVLGDGDIPGEILLRTFKLSKNKYLEEQHLGLIHFESH